MAYHRIYGLVGHPLAHSFSETYFSNKFRQLNLQNCEYRLFDIKQPAQIESLKKLPDLMGLNVTLPYKVTVMSWLDSVDPVASEIGAVNTIRIQNGHWRGYNTDVHGFSKSLQNHIQQQPSRALVLGSGGVSRAVIYALKTLGIAFVQVSRNPEGDRVSYESLRKNIGIFELIVNCTPAGMYPYTDQMPGLPLTLFKPGVLVFDTIYNPAETLLLKIAASRGCEIVNGLEMLYLQAEKSWELWNT